jgi:trehalose 6-phosphate synthase
MPTEPGQSASAPALPKPRRSGLLEARPMATRRTQGVRAGLVIVANRLPVRHSKSGWEISPGGLVTAMTPILRDCGGGWVGWTGEADTTLDGFDHEGIALQPVPMSRHEVDSFYAGFSNRTLWPLYHDAIRTPEFRRRWWAPYVAVNRRFAEAAAEVAGEEDTIWVHDYHLQLAPCMIRKLRPKARIGFFLHIPFPSQELFSRLPWRKEILEGLLGADVVGFQTRLGAQNFGRACRRFTSARGMGSVMDFEGRKVRVGAFPISIDTARFEEVAADAETLVRADQLRQRLGRRRIILGVDRLDYTKGIDVRLKTIEELLRRNAASADEIVYVQIAVPSREKVAEYADMRRRIEELVGRINGQYGEAGRVVVHYLRRNLSERELVAYYRAADIMLVTPLRDGMNLVAKEFVACRLDNTGVLVLSEFAGASRELRRAILVNPFDIDGCATALEAALRVTAREAARRMSALRRVVRSQDVFAWADGFLGVLRA